MMSEDHASIWLNLLVLGISLLCTTTLLAALHKFRNLAQVQKLQPALHSWYILVAFCICLIYSIGDGFLLLTWKQFGYLMYPFIGSTNAIQSLIIFETYIKFCATEDKIKLAAVVLNNVIDLYKPEGIQLLKIIEIIMHRKMFMIGFCLMVAATASLPMYIFINTYRSNIDLFNQHMDAVEFAPLIYSTMLVTILSILQSLPSVWIIKEVQRRNENAEIQKSLQFVVNFNLGTVLFMILVYASPLRRISFDTVNFKPLIVFHIHLIILCSMMLYSLMKIVREKKAHTRRSIVRLGSSMDASSNLESLMYDDLVAFLQDSKGFRLMLQVARKNFNVENVLFFGAVSQWKKTFADNSPEKRLKDANDIFDLFCSKNSKAELNLSSQTRIDINKSFEKLKEFPDNLRPNLFDNANLEILSLMYSETFVEAQMTPEFKDFSKKSSSARQTSKDKLLSVA